MLFVSVIRSIFWQKSYIISSLNNENQITILRGFTEILLHEKVKFPQGKLLPLLVYFWNKPTYVDNFIAIFEKKGPRPKWTIFKHVSDKSKKCLSVICGQLPAYPILYRAPKYLLKVPYIILVVTNVAKFLIFDTVFLGRMATLA